MADKIPTIDDFMQFEAKLLNKVEIILSQNATATDKKWLKSKDVRKLLGNISPGKLQEMRIKKEIPFTKLGSTYFYDYDEVVKVLKSNEINDNSHG